MTLFRYGGGSPERKKAGRNEALLAVTETINEIIANTRVDHSSDHLFSVARTQCKYRQIKAIINWRNSDFT